jgi:hypothetical protein
MNEKKPTPEVFKVSESKVYKNMEYVEKLFKFCAKNEEDTIAEIDTDTDNDNNTQSDSDDELLNEAIDTSIMKKQESITTTTTTTSKFPISEKLYLFGFYGTEAIVYEWEYIYRYSLLHSVI